MERLIITLTMMLTAFMATAQSCPDDNHPHAIDLGLPSGTRWACCNVGAAIPEGDGSRYAWGETEEKDVYDWTTYIHCDGSMETCHDLGQDISGTEYDVAHVQWGGSWVMPTQGQIQEMTSMCSCAWTVRNGVNGDVFTGPNGSTIFMAESGIWRKGRDNSAFINYDNDVLDAEADELPSAGYYWASTQEISTPSFANYILFSYGNAYWDANIYRCMGLAVRPVMSVTTDIDCSRPTTDDGRQAAYNIYGIKVTDVISVDSKVLPPGIYIINGKKVILK